jgi:hypothetical protein
MIKIHRRSAGRTLYFESGSTRFARIVRELEIRTRRQRGLLKPWTKDGELTETVFKTAAKIPMEWIGENLRHGLPFDVEDFMRRVRDALARRMCGCCNRVVTTVPRHNSV